MLKITCQLDSWPKTPESYYPASYTEGVLRFSLDDKELVVINGALLVEFAICCHKWLITLVEEANADLNYSSMDFEEESLFRAKWTNENKMYFLTSGLNETFNCFVSLEDLKTAIQTYLDNLENALKITPIDLKKVLKNIN